MSSNIRQKDTFYKTLVNKSFKPNNLENYKKQQNKKLELEKAKAKKKLEKQKKIIIENEKKKEERDAFNKYHEEVRKWKEEMDFIAYKTQKDIQKLRHTNNAKNK